MSYPVAVRPTAPPSRLVEAFHVPGAPVYRAVQGGVGLLIVASLGVLGAQLWWGVGMPPWLSTADDALLVVFVVEILLRVATYAPPGLTFYRHSGAGRVWAHVSGRVRYCFSPFNVIDILSVLALVPGLRALRALRLLRLVRGVTFFRYSSPLRSFVRAASERSLLFAFVMSLMGVQVLVGGTSLYLAEAGANPGLQTLADGFWWAIVTITTVGFGDIAPVTALGRVIGTGLMIGGLFTLAVFTGVIGHAFMGTVLTLQKEQFRMTQHLDHVVICGYDAGARMLLDALVSELAGSQQRIVIFAPGERPADIPPEMLWVSGDPTKESELEKVRVGHAAAVVVVGSRAVPPQQADAVTILTAFTLRRWIKRSGLDVARERPLYIVAEVLDSENVEHAAAAGCDEVIETTRLGFSLLAHAIVMPGTGAVMSRVASAGAHSLYVGRLPADCAPIAFEALAARLKPRRALLIGVREGTRTRLNPTEDTVIAPGCDVIYLAESPVEVG